MEKAAGSGRLRTRQAGLPGEMLARPGSGGGDGPAGLFPAWGEAGARQERGSRRPACPYAGSARRIPGPRRQPGSSAGCWSSEGLGSGR